tara:strand:+ start:188 stop:1102 length:915 start_codon:yes stop_codon:yes gene_type:complete
MKKSKKILIVGGTGFIGYHLAKRCLKKGWVTHSLSSKKPIKKRFLKKVKYLICDISIKRSLKNKLKDKYNFVVNLGGYVDHSNITKTYKSHYLGCKNLSEIFINSEITSFIQIGSSSEYGRNKSPQHEKLNCKPTSIYGRSKLLATQHLINLYYKNNFPCTVLRLYQVYGPFQDYNRFITFVIKSCINNKNFPCSHGNQFRDFVYVSDVVDAIIKTLIKKESKGKIINIGSGKVKKIKNIIEIVKKLVKGGEPNYGAIKLRKDEMTYISPNLKLSNNILNWKPKISFKKGLNNTIKYIKKDLRR